MQCDCQPYTYVTPPCTSHLLLHHVFVTITKPHSASLRSSLLNPLQEGMEEYRSPNLTIQVWDNNHFGPGDYLGEKYRIRR